MWPSSGHRAKALVCTKKFALCKTKKQEGEVKGEGGAKEGIACCQKYLEGKEERYVMFRRLAPDVMVNLLTILSSEKGKKPAGGL